MIKACTNCKIDKPLTEYYKNKQGKYGVYSKCKDCVKRYRNSVKDERTKYIEQYNSKHKERRKEYSRHWLENNRERHNANKARRRAAKKNQTPELSKLEKSMITGLYFISRVLSKSCGEPFEVDHIMPISKGGGHTYDNLQILTRAENRRKHAKINWCED